MMQNAIIVGASSGIGKELAKILARHGCNVGLAARRFDLLREVARDIQTKAVVKVIDVSKPIEAMQSLRELIAEMNEVDLFVISSGTGFINSRLEWGLESETIALAFRDLPRWRTLQQSILWPEDQATWSEFLRSLPFEEMVRRRHKVPQRPSCRITSRD
jgi:NAD(P)-dependent dehydrogenase (short-subunit alcohol dehydrogenase family)